MENVPNNHFTDETDRCVRIAGLNFCEKPSFRGENAKKYEDSANYTRIPEAMLRSPNVILGSVLVVKKWDIGICWDLSQSHVQYVSGINPIVKKRGFWDQSQCLVQVVSGIACN